MTLPIHEHPELPRLLRKEFADDYADPRWRGRMAPQLSYGRHTGPARSSARQAAVAIMLYRQDSVWHIPLTVRHAELRTHAGQVSFPGGALEAGENSRDAAQREFVEELFTDRRTGDVVVEWLGGWAPLHVYVSNMQVAPWVGVLHQDPDWRLQKSEVHQVLSLSLKHLLSNEWPDDMQIQRGSLDFSAPRWIVDGFDVWGSTAILLGELRGRLQRLSTREVST